MTPALHRRSWRPARVAPAVLALTLAALVGPASAASTAAGHVPATSSSSAAAVGAVPCATGRSAQRVRAGADGVDPNDVTLAETRQAESELADRTRQRRTSGAREALPSTRIDVYVHVIERSGGSGGVSASRIKKQIAVLNAAYAGTTSAESAATPFTFRLARIDRTKKTSWYHWAAPTDTSDGDDAAPKKKLHRGGPDDLNLYLASLDDGVLGYSSFPFATTLARDGVVVLNATLPGGKADGYATGDTVTHEVGHWLGLFHTFENGCAAPGDEVDDTPAQADGPAVFFCRDTDTCAAPGRDPGHNFMSYGDDACLDRFTPGQVERMVAVWQAYRAPGSTS